MKKLLMLGSSLASVEIIRKAKQRGWYTIVTDNLSPEKSPGKKVSDAYWMISTAETDLLEAKCREEGINAIFSGVSEFNLDKVSIMTRDLGLPCYIDEHALTFARNKRNFKNKCIEKGIPVIPEYPIPDNEAAWEQIIYPVVVKPINGTGNAGLSICHNRKELEEGIRKAEAFNADSELIIERYLTGQESWNYYFFAEGTGRYVYSGSVFKQPGYPTYLYSFGTSAVNADDYLAQMEPMCSELLREIGCRDGIAWVQCMRDDDGNFYAVEMAHRMSADTSGDMQEKGLGFNPVDWMLDTALGVRHTADMLPVQVAPPYNGATCVYYMFADHAGTIEKMEGLADLDPDCFRVEAIKRPGDYVDQYRIIVKITFFARHTEEMCQMLKQLNQTIKIPDSIGKDLVIRFTDYEAVKQRHKGLMQEPECL